MFYRKIEDQLYKYYSDVDAKIPVINGARQVRKSFIIRETAKKVFRNYIEINLKDDSEADQLFAGILSNILYRNNISAILNQDSGVNLGSVYETTAAMELAAHGHSLFYFDSKKVGEVDFLVNDYDDLSVLPIEIKSGKDQYNFRALPKLTDRNGPYKLKRGIVFGNKNIVET